MGIMSNISQAKRLVIKIGTALLVDDCTGNIHQTWLDSLIEDVVQCYQRGQQIIIVSSGAVALGRNQLNFKRNPLPLEAQQAAAATGQIRLAHAYQSALAKHDINVAQILLTLQDSENRWRFLNARNTLESLLKANAIPIINENDTVATEELRYGDNDRLAARVAQMVDADMMVLLSDIDGLYTADPSIDANAKLILEVREITPEIQAMAGGSNNHHGSGGMVTKLAAAQIAMGSGCRMVIADGRQLHPLVAIEKKQASTWFIPNTTPLCARKNWLCHHLQPHGHMAIDEGACIALENGKSLLPIGILSMTGEFQKGDAISIMNPSKTEIARGLSNYAHHEAIQLIGKHSHEIPTILGYMGNAEMIHRNNLVML